MADTSNVSEKDRKRREFILNGKPMAVVLSISLPLILLGAFSYLSGIIDTLVVAKSDNNALSSVVMISQIKNLFTAHDFPCVFDGDALAFRSKAHGDDFATMWDIILSLLRSDWFLDCATSCVWLDEDGEEDILAQVGKVQEQGV